MTRSWPIKPGVLLMLAITGSAHSEVHASGLYSITPLGVNNPSIPMNFEARAIDNSGRVYGYTTDGSNGTYSVVYDSRSNGNVSLLIPGSSNSQAGSSSQFEVTNANNNGAAIVTNFPNTQYSLVGSNGQVTSLPGTASGINDSGTVIGQLSNPSNTYWPYQPYVYSNGTVQVLPLAPGTKASLPDAINNAGEIVFYTNSSSAPIAHAYTLSGTTWTDLGTLGGALSRGTAINSQGDVVGYSTPAGTNDYQAFLVPHGGTMIGLGVLPGGAMSIANAINDKGQIVGSSDIGSNGAYGFIEHAFIYQNGIMEDLNKLLPQGSGWILTSATSINDAGQILAIGQMVGTNSLGQNTIGNPETILLNPDGMGMSVAPLYPLAQPAPEPSTLAAFGLIAVALGRRLSRRRSGSL